MTKYILILLLLINTAYGQAVSTFGATSSSNYSKTGGMMWTPAHATNDTNKVAGFDSTGKLVLRTKSNGVSFDTTGLLRKRDTSRNGIVVTYWVLDSTNRNNVRYGDTSTKIATKTDLNARISYTDTTSKVATKWDLTTYTPQSRTITINGVSQDLSANSTYTIPTTDTTSLSNRINARIPYQDTTITIATRTYLNNWAGSTSLTTLGTIATGTWNATTIPTNKGGTGLTSIGTANRVLGVNSGATGLEYKSFATGTTGTDFNIAHTANTVTFNLPTASSTVRGLLSSANWTTFNNKIGGSGTNTYIPMFTGASTIAESAIRSDGNYASINMPVNTLYRIAVTGNTYTSGINYTGNDGGIANANNTGISILTKGGTGMTINTIAGGYYIDIKEGTTNIARIGDGKILVRSTTNRGTGNLEVTGNVSVLGTTGNTYRWDATSGTPSNTATPAGWVKISIAGVDAWLPYYQ